MENVPVFISIVFGFTVLLTVLLFNKAANKQKTVLIVITAWIVIQSLIGLSGFYAVSNATPPRFMLLVLPPVMLIVLLFVSKI